MPGADRIGGVAECHRLAVHLHQTAFCLAKPAQHVEQFVLPLPLERYDPQHLAPVQIERHIGQFRPRRQVAHRQAGLPSAGRLAPRGGLGGGQFRPQHQFDHTFLDPRFNWHIAHRYPVAQHGSAVAQPGNFGETVTDVDDRPPRIGLLADHDQDLFNKVRWQCCGHLIQHQYLWLGGQGAGQIKNAQRRQRQIPRRIAQVQSVDAQRVNPMQERIDRRPAQPQVLRNIQIGDQRWFLIHRHQPTAPRRPGRGETAVGPANPQRAAITLQGAGQDFY